MAGPTSTQQIEERIAAQAMRPMGRTPITVTNADVEDVTVTLTTAVTLPGKVTIEGQALSTLTGIDRMRVNLRAARGGIPDTGGGQQPAPGVIGADGSFQITGVREGEYIAAVNVAVARLLRQKHSIWRLGYPEQLVQVFRFRSREASMCLFAPVQPG